MQKPTILNSLYNNIPPSTRVDRCQILPFMLQLHVESGNWALLPVASVTGRPSLYVIMGHLIDGNKTLLGEFSTYEEASKAIVQYRNSGINKPTITAGLAPDRPKFSNVLKYKVVPRKIVFDEDKGRWEDVNAEDLHGVDYWRIEAFTLEPNDKGIVGSFHTYEEAIAAEYDWRKEDGIAYGMLPDAPHYTMFKSSEISPVRWEDRMFKPTTVNPEAFMIYGIKPNPLSQDGVSRQAVGIFKNRYEAEVALALWWNPNCAPKQKNEDPLANDFKKVVVVDYPFEGLTTGFRQWLTSDEGKKYRNYKDCSGYPQYHIYDFWPAEYEKHELPEEIMNEIKVMNKIVDDNGADYIRLSKG